MARWGKLSSKTTIQELVGVRIKEPVTLQATVAKYREAMEKSGQQHWSVKKLGTVTSAVNVEKQLNSLTVGDFKNADSSGKTIIQRLVKFAATGVLDTEKIYPDRVGPGSGIGGKGNGKFAFRAVPTADVLKLVPIEGLDGKYQMLKLQVHEFVSGLPNGTSATIDQPKGIKPKTVGVILKEVNDMLEKNRKPWKLYHNPLHTVFILTPKKGA